MRLAARGLGRTMFTLLHNYTKPSRRVPAPTEASSTMPHSRSPTDKRHPDALSCKRYALGHQQRAFEGLAASVSARTPPGRNDPVARDVRPIARAHDVPHRASRSRLPGPPGDLAVRRDLTTRNAANRGEHSRGERRVAFCHETRPCRVSAAGRATCAGRE